MAHPDTAAIIKEIRKDAEAGREIFPHMFSAFYSRQHVSAAFRIAKSFGIVENLTGHNYDGTVWVAGPALRG